MFHAGFGVTNPAPSSTASWYFYLQNDPRGSPDGWYPYDSTMNQQVEQSFLSNLPFTLAASGRFSYHVNFVTMTQTNSSTGMARPIARTTNGFPPPHLPPSVQPVPPGPAPVNNPFNPFHAAAAAAVASIPVAAFPPSPFASSYSNTTDTNKHRARWSGQTLVYTAPDNLRQAHIDEKQVFSEIDEEKKDNSDECVICLDNLHNDSGERVVALSKCAHAFHYNCIRASLDKVGAKCPYCSQSIQAYTAATPLGQCPSGTMNVYRSSESCSGYEPSQTLKISYNIPSGTQMSYHPSPGIQFSGVSRIAYLPDVPAGRDLLVRLQYAFAHGLTFRVGTSLTTHQPNVVTWASLHHKTSLSGGSFGFPDATYIDRCNAELNDKQVPAADICRTWLSQL